MDYTIKFPKKNIEQLCNIFTGELFITKEDYETEVFNIYMVCRTDIDFYATDGCTLCVLLDNGEIDEMHESTLVYKVTQASDIDFIIEE